MSPAPLPAGQARVSDDAAQPGVAAPTDPSQIWLRSPGPKNQGTATLQPLIAMAYTLEDFRHDTWRQIIEDVPNLSPDEREALLARMDIEDRLRGLNAEERLRGLDPEEVLKRYAPEEILRQMDPAAITAWLKRTGH